MSVTFITVVTNKVSTLAYKAATQLNDFAIVWRSILSLSRNAANIATHSYQRERYHDPLCLWVAHLSSDRTRFFCAPFELESGRIGNKLRRSNNYHLPCRREPPPA